MRNKITISARIWLVVLMCLGVGGTAIGVLAYELKATSTAYEQTLQELQSRARQQDEVRVMQVAFKKEVQEWKDTLLRGYNLEDLTKYSGQFHAAVAKVDSIGSALQASVTDPDTREALDAFVQAHAAMKLKYEAALLAFTADHGANPRVADQLVKGQDRAPTDLIDKAVAAAVKRSNAAVASEKEVVARTILRALLLVLVAFLAIGVVAALTIRKLSGALRQAVTELNETARQVAGAASQVSGTSQSLAQGCSEQAASLEETSAATAQIDAMARRNSESSRSAAGLAAQSKQEFIGTDQSLEKMVAATDEIDRHSAKIATIVKSIDEIAFQTNILALNAAVEAARAGEAGAGFAVVADEVRNLARRSAQAAKDTAELIEQSVAKSAGGKTRVDQVVVAIRNISEQSSKVKTLVDEVDLGSREQQRGIEQISKAILQMDQVTQSAAASAEEGAAAAEELSAQSDALRDVVESLAAMVGE